MFITTALTPREWQFPASIPIATRRYSGANILWENGVLVAGSWTHSLSFHHKECTLIFCNRWLGFIYPYEYEEYAKGVPCQGYIGKVTRTVNLDPEEFKDSKTKEQLWAGRELILRERMVDFWRQQRFENYERLRTHEEANQKSDFDRTYFMEEEDKKNPDSNRC